MFSVSNSFISSLKRNALGGLLLAAMSFPLAAAPETTVLTPDQDWMPTTDLSLPRQMKIGALENGIRYVVMPSRYSQKTVSLRFELQTASNQTWLVANEADLNSRSLKEALVELRDKVLVNDKVPAAPQSKLTVILVGDIQVRDAIDQIDIVFGGAKIGNSIPGRLFADKLSQSLEQPVDAETSAQPVAANIYLKTRLTDDQEDSKMRRKELTASQLADDVLMARLEKQLLEANIGLVAVEMEESWSRQQLVSTITVALSNEEELDSAKTIVAKVLEGAKNGNVTADEFATQVQLRHDLFKRHLKVSPSQQADGIAQAIRFNRVYVQPSDELRLFEFHIAHMTESDVSESMIVNWSKGTEMLSHVTGQ